jgi:hypothetical protein
LSTIIRDRLQVDCIDYAIDACPLDILLATLPAQPVEPPTPWRQNGYVATWVIVDGVMVIRKVSRESIARKFADVRGPVTATWFSGIIYGWRGERRNTRYPARTFFNDEIVLEISLGRVTREWRLDLRTFPGQTDEKLRLSLPEFLWPPQR